MTTWNSLWRQNGGTIAPSAVLFSILILCCQGVITPSVLKGWRFLTLLVVFWPKVIFENLEQSVLGTGKDISAFWWRSIQEATSVNWVHYHVARGKSHGHVWWAVPDRRVQRHFGTHETAHTDQIRWDRHRKFIGLVALKMQLCIKVWL